MLIARAAGHPLDEFLRERVFEPLSMVDTGFSVGDLDRFGTCYGTDPAGERFVFDPPDGQWATPPQLPSGASGLVSTLDDLHAFGRMLLSGGRLPDGSRLMSRASIDAMTSDQIDVASGAPGPLPDGPQGWGFGVGVQVRRSGLGPPIGAYGWAGGMGSLWTNVPSNELVCVMLTTDAFGGRSRRPLSSRTSRPACTPRSTTDQGGRHAIACSDTRSPHRRQRALRQGDALGDVVDVLESAELFWISTVRANGRPHVTPLPAVWRDGALYFCTGPGEQKALNPSANDQCALTTGDNRWKAGLDVVVEGGAERVTDDATLRALAAMWETKYDGDWRYDVRDGAFSREPGVAHVFEVRPRKVLSFAKGDFAQTRFRFDG